MLKEERNVVVNRDQAGTQRVKAVTTLIGKRIRHPKRLPFPLFVHHKGKEGAGQRFRSGTKVAANAQSHPGDLPGDRQVEV